MNEEERMSTADSLSSAESMIFFIDVESCGEVNHISLPIKLTRDQTRGQSIAHLGPQGR